MKVYTKTGDNGTTSLVGGERVSKTDPRIEAYGTADELNSFIGLLRAMPASQKDTYEPMLNKIQNTLFVIGGALATPADKREKYKLQITKQDVESIENDIDTLSEGLPEHHAFILPAGNQTIALCHICRTVCRRLERRILAIEDSLEKPDFMLQYVNRLSDFMYILSKNVHFYDKINVFLWKNG
ncbi:MAG: cob(I)yrinic acid a,c-diamide adenosyltransferase [Paludibacteraceae bacterium]|nr:cob(I)yrinic acid a,c-diamide adenosyltransferase [Paludibacteraceae bacterium]